MNRDKKTFKYINIVLHCVNTNIQLFIDLKGKGKNKEGVKIITIQYNINNYDKQNINNNINSINQNNNFEYIQRRFNNGKIGIKSDCNKKNIYKSQPINTDELAITKYYVTFSQRNVENKRISQCNNQQIYNNH